MNRSVAITGLVISTLFAQPIWAATTLLFDVSGQRSERQFGTTTSTVPTGAFSFQLSVSLDDGGYTFSDMLPPDLDYIPPEWVDYTYDGHPIINNIASPSLDQTEQFAQSHGMDTLYGINPTSSDNYLSYARFMESSFLGFSEQVIAFNKTRTEQRLTPDPNFPPIGTREFFKADSFRDRMSLEYEYDQPQPGLDISSFDAYIATLQGLIGEQDAFSFEHSAYYGETVFCDDSTTTFCDIGIYEPYYGSALLEFNGTATLVGISEVPLPAAAWLFLTALGGLGIYGRARK